MLTLSTAEAESIALCCAAQENALYHKLAIELGFWQLSPTPICKDNLGAKVIAETGYSTVFQRMVQAFTASMAMDYNNGQWWSDYRRRHSPHKAAS